MQAPCIRKTISFAKVQRDCESWTGSEKKKKRKQMRIVRTGDVSNTQVVKTKLLSMFAARFAPDFKDAPL